MIRLPPRGLYAITSEAICAEPLRLQRSVAAALRGGARLIQYRDKHRDADTRHRNALLLQALCTEAGVPLLINDGPAGFVAQGGFDGMHLGSSDDDLAAARLRCPQALIGATCGQSLGRAVTAVQAGASYVAFGAFYPSSTKPEALPASLSLLAEARAVLAVPICAIGGITPANAAPLIAAGAHYIAAIEGVFGAPDIEVAARAYAQLFED